MSASMTKILLQIGRQNLYKFRSPTELVPLREYSSDVKTKALLYSEYGDPSKVVKSAEIDVDAMTPQSVRVQMLAAPINPADINTIQGVYPVKPNLPAVGGFEGVGRITQVGSDVTHLKTGDIVLPAINALGTWRKDLVCSSEHVMSIPSDTPIVTAAMLKVNGSTAYRMMMDYVKLTKGDSIIQNAANSGAGQAVIQIAAARGVNTINIIRDRPNVDELKAYLSSIGASIVLTEEEMRKDAANLLKWISKPKLAFNAVGGKSAINLFKALEPGGTIVTYGGMSKQPLIVPTGSLIFNDVKVVGYWMTRWYERNAYTPEAKAMISDLCAWAKSGQLKAPQHQQVPFEDYQSAIEKTMESFTSSKQVLRFE